MFVKGGSIMFEVIKVNDLITTPHYIEWCERKDLKPQEAKNLLMFKEVRVFKDNSGSLYFDSLDDVFWDHTLGTFVFMGTDLEILMELGWLT